jgi:hypothetical protein
VALSRLEAEKSRRSMAKQARWEMICLQVICDDGEDLTAERKRIHAEHLEQPPEDILGRGPGRPRSAD